MMLTLQSIFWILFVTMVVGFWHIEKHLQRIMDRFNETDDEIEYIQTKLGIDRDTKELMNKIKAAKMEY